MTAVLLTHPAKAAELVCHDEQLRIWADDVVGLMSMEGWLKDDLSYGDGVDLVNAIKRELKKVVESAFTHPEAMKRGRL